MLISGSYDKTISLWDFRGDIRNFTESTCILSIKCAISAMASLSVVQGYSCDAFMISLFYFS